jgi:GT2 family glycosyltransferase
MDSPPEFPCNLSVSVVLYQTAPEQLESTLASLARAIRRAREADLASRAQVVLVDNSADAAYAGLMGERVSAWATCWDLPMVYRNEGENRGFGAGHNAALSGLESDVHLILNPDVETGEDALRIGLARLRDERDLALLSPRVCAEDGRQEYLCKRYPSVLVLLLRAFAPRFVQNWFRGRLDRYQMTDVCGGEQAAEVPLASGCFMLAPTGALQGVGGFNERYFLYFEDFDLSIRLRGEGRLLFEPAMQIVHHGGYAARKGFRHVGYFIRSGIRFFNDHGWHWI